MNDITLNWNKLRRYNHSENTNSFEDQPYTFEQIRKMLEQCDLRTKVLILVMTSAGVRVGSFPSIQKKHLVPFDTPKGKLYQLMVYGDDKKHKYITYCTPECSKAIDEYFAFRSRSGEKITDNSYLIRKEFRVGDYPRIQKDTGPIQTNTITGIIHSILRKTGLREVKEDNQEKNSYRYPNQINHAFRKTFINELMRCKLTPEHREKLSGHGLPKNDDNYLRFAHEELFPEYLKAVDSLTVDKSLVFEKQVQQLEEDKNQVQLLELKHKQEMDMVLKQMKEMKQNVGGLIEQKLQEMFGDVVPEEIGLSRKFLNKEKQILKSLNKSKLVGEEQLYFPGPINEGREVPATGEKRGRMT